MKRRILSILLVLCLIIPVLPVQAAAADRGAFRSVVYIPLDDRPYNDSRVEMMAASLGIELIMPEENLYATTLDGQPTNPNGTQYGDREALVTWLQNMDASYDTFVISLDQLLSGGLMNSRCLDEMTPLTFDDGTQMTEYEVIDLVSELAEHNEVYIIDSILRLATSCDYGNYKIAHYQLSREYGMVDRPVLSGGNLTVEKIIAAYPYGADGRTPAELQAGFSQNELDVLHAPLSASQEQWVSASMVDAYLAREDPEEFIPVSGTVTSIQLEGSGEGVPKPSLLETYLKTRERKLRLLDYSTSRLCGRKNVHYLLGVDDSSAGNNIQTNEIAMMESRFGAEQDHIFSALDGLGQMALCRLRMESSNLAVPRVNATFYSGVEKTVPTFNCDTVENMVTEILAYCFARETDGDADISLILYYGGNDLQTANRHTLNLISQLNENEANHIPTILLDMDGDRYKTIRDEAIAVSTHPGMLLSFAGKEDGANRLLMGICQGLSRYLVLHTPSLQTSEVQAGHVQNLSCALLKNFGRTSESTAVLNALYERLGISATDFGTLTQSQKDALNSTLNETLAENTASLRERLSGGNYLASLEPYTLGGIQSVSQGNCTFPWWRHFEIECVPAVSIGSAYAAGTLHRKYVVGYDDNNFGPDRYVTREQTAKMLVGAVEVELNQNLGQRPDDVAAWAWPYVSTAKAKGYIRGYTDGTFRGGNNITRAEFAALLSQYIAAENLQLPVKKTSVFFTDIPENSSAWYRRNVYQLAKLGIINGYTDGSFRPNANITRAEAVTMLNRLTGRQEELPDALMNMLRFSDQKNDWATREIQEASISHFCD